MPKRTRARTTRDMAFDSGDAIFSRFFPFFPAGWAFFSTGFASLFSRCVGREKKAIPAASATMTAR
ncbi:MAG: hypothetical protein A4E39_01686 [Methanoregulaceae archaeon PtaB.Bin152]|nr:MAG: hypothetical protein A4E39_01686 [Methanoregulaceae archaeon PtaB.Bin152]